MKGLIFNNMDKQLMDIYSIKDIELINFTDLVPFTVRGKYNLIPSLLIKYDGGKYLNLCSKDKYFDIYVKKVYEVYNKEKDKVKIDDELNPFSKDKTIEISEDSKRILESKELLDLPEIYKFYDGKRNYSNSLLFQEDELKLLLPLIKYQVKELFQYTDLTINFPSNEINGFRNNYTINSLIDGIDELILISYEKIDEDKFIFRVKSNSKLFENIEMRLTFNRNSINVITAVPNYDLVKINEYKLKDDGVYVDVSAYKKGMKVAYKEELLPTCDVLYPNVANIDGKSDLNWYKLPWDAYYGYRINNFPLSDLESKKLSHTKYLSISDDSFFMKDYLNHTFEKNETLTVGKAKVVLDEVKKTVKGIKMFSDKDLYVLETGFDYGVHKNGYYDNYLGGKYYYHVGTGSKLMDLKNENLVSFSKNNDIIYGADLLYEENLRKVLRR